MFSRSGRNREAAVEADVIGEQQTKRGAELKRTQSGSSSRSGRNREAVDNREQQLRRTQAAKSS